MTAASIEHSEPSTRTADSGTPPTYDLVGIGCGPANLALAALLEEEREAGRDGVPSALFLERRPHHAWHPGMLLEDSLIQISVLKDLVTVRNPRSRFTFLSYLEQRGRLFEFLNLRDLFPTRLEFNDYLGWVADELSRWLRYGCEVTAVAPVGGTNGRGVELLEVRHRNPAGGEEAVLARNLVVATGGVPRLPPGIEIEADGHAFHPRDFLTRLERDYADTERAYRFVVVGGGQSGAEIFYYLASRYRNADVTAALRRFGYKPVDDSDFTNEVFFPEMVDFVFDLPDERRREVVDSFRDVNYAVVDAPLIREIYRFLYREKLAGRNRARVRSFVELRRVEETGTGVVAHFEDRLRGGEVRLAADGLVLATGYRWDSRHPLLRGLDPYLERDAGGGYRMRRDYGVVTTPGFAPGIYLQGYCEATHGISETVLSLLPIRALDIYRSLGAAGDRAEAGLGSRRAAPPRAPAAGVDPPAGQEARNR